ncbi:hypothetical protein AB6A40_007459 [Gnathostoma spinigerum]|uniref:SEFIR domain-containing protein n=1 Tax=Gnathostoma spinigerum TaxID=75299 RepID=A0ABD6ELA6_9BILA
MNQEGKKDLLSKVVTEITPRHYRDTIWSVLLLILLFLILFILVVLTYFLSVKYRRDQLSGKTVRIRFTSDRTRGLETPSVVPICQTPLIRNTNLRVLLVYSHDCAAHDAAVLSLAEYLRDCLNFEVHLDMWDSGEINRNLMDYITLSILNADKILIINSVGALYRYRDKVKREFRITRNRPGPYDDLFALQIDQALTCSSVISVRFCYTTFQIVLPPLSYALQYVLPDNLDPLISAMTETKMNIDPRRFSFSSSLSKLFSAVENMNDLIHSDRRWFERDHYHIPVVPCQPLDVLSKNASGEVASVRWNLFTEKQMPRTSISLSNEYERLLVTSVTRPTALEINSERISCSNRIPYTDHIYDTNSPPSERQSEPTFGVTVQIGSDVSHIPTHATDRDTSGSWDHLKGYAVSSQTDSGVFSCPFTTNLTL